MTHRSASIVPSILVLILLCALSGCAGDAEPVPVPDSGPPESPAAIDACDDVLAQGRPGGEENFSLADSLWESCWRRKTASDIWGEGE
ncbi:MAG: hypothetical protein AAF530_18835 [Pseudomonadota bacterium]